MISRFSSQVKNHEIPVIDCEIRNFRNTNLSSLLIDQTTFIPLYRFFFLNKKNEILFIVPNCIKNGLFFLKIQKKKNVYLGIQFISQKNRSTTI